MKKIKTFFKIVFWIIVVLLVVLLALPLWIGPLAKCAANKTVPGIIKTDFNLGEFGLNPYAGSFSVGDMQIANPTNFAKENCIELTRLSAKMDVKSAFTKKIHVEHMTLDGLYIRTTPLAENFKQLAANASGEKEEAAATQKEAQPAQKPETAPQQARSAEPGAEGEEEEIRFVIDRIVLSNVTINYSGLPIPIPTLTIEGIGADKEEGASLTDVVVAVWEAIVKATGSVGKALQGVGSDAIDIGQGVLDTGANAVEAVKKLDVEAVKDSAQKLKESAKDLKNLFKKNK